jgi:hypothetical protein
MKLPLKSVGKVGLGRKAVPWFMAFEVLLAARDRWGQLTPSERDDLQRLLAKSRNPKSFSPQDRARLKQLAGRMDLLGLGKAAVVGHQSARRRPR